MNTPRIVLLLTLLAWCGWSTAARAQSVLPAAGGAAPARLGAVADSEPTHAWAVVPTGADGSAVVLHLPPRGASRGMDGRVRQAADIRDMPRLVAAWGDRFFLLYPAGTDDQGVWRVFTVQAVASTFADAWMSSPPQGLDVLPPLEAGATPLSATGSAIGLVVLTRGAEGPGLRGLIRGAWVKLQSPEAVRGARSAPGDLRVLASSDALLLLTIDTAAGGARLWRAGLKDVSMQAPAPDAKAELALHWSSRWIDLSATALGGVAPEEIGAVVVADRLVLGNRRGDGTLDLAAVELRAGELSVRALAAAPGVPSQYGLAPLSGVDRVAVVELIPKDEGHTGELRVIEVSAATGGLMHTGSTNPRSPFRKPEYILLVVMLLEMSACALVFILKPDDGSAVTLPEGFALAPVFRRALAGAIDLSLMLGVSRWFWESYGQQVLGEGDGQLARALAAGISTVLLLIAAGALLEAMLGRTIGKVLVGIEVVQLPGARDPIPELRRPSLARTLVRNMVKWGLPPIGLLGLLDPEGRHRGDQFTRTLCVQRFEEEPGRGGDDEGDEA